jgi:drug/metabolite transporter (DMT)-like permease
MVAMKGAIPHTTPLFLAVMRLLPAGLLVLLASMWMGRSQPKGWLAWSWIIAFALVDGTLFQGFLGEGLLRTDAGLGSVMIDSQPLVVALLALWLFGERMGLWGWLGMSFGIAGISLLGLPEEWTIALGRGDWSVTSLGHGVFWGDFQILQGLLENGQWLMLMAALSMAVGTVLSRYVSRHVDSIVATGWHMVLGSLPLLWGSWQWETDQWLHLNWADYAAMGYSTVFGTAIAYGLFFCFATQGSLTSLSALTFLTPVFALSFGNLILNEALSLIQWTGVGLTLTSIYLINQRDSLTSQLQKRVQRFSSRDAARSQESLNLGYWLTFLENGN